jgi:hypothetical protein
MNALFRHKKVRFWGMFRSFYAAVLNLKMTKSHPVNTGWLFVNRTV